MAAAPGLITPSSNESPRMDATNPAPLATQVYRFLSDGTAMVVRHWRPADALRCRRCSPCTAYDATALAARSAPRFTCAVTVPSEGLAARLF